MLLPQGLEGEGGERKTVVELEAAMEKGEAESQPDTGYVTVFKLLYIPLLGVTLLLVILNFYFSFPTPLLVVLLVMVVLQYFYWFLLVRLLTLQHTTVDQK